MIEYQVYIEDVRAWTESNVTKYVFQLLREHFDHQKHLQGTDAGIERFKGRADVLHYLYNSKEILNLIPK